MIGPLHHIGIAVRSLEAALVAYGRLGLEPESIHEIPDWNVRVAFLPAGGARLELLEALEPDGVIAKFIDRRGEGLHHVAFTTPDIHAEMRRLRDMEFELVDVKPHKGAHGRWVAFVHPKSAHGVLLELVEDLPGQTG